MIKYPVKTAKRHFFMTDDKYRILDDEGKCIVTDSGGELVAICRIPDVANTIANALNAIHMFPKHTLYPVGAILDWVNEWLSKCRN